MSYAGLGQILRTGTAPLANLSVNRPSSPALINVGIPPTLVTLVGTFLSNTGATMGQGDASRVPIIIVGGALKKPTLNSFGLVDPTWVAKLLNQVPAAVRVWLDGFPNAPKVDRLLTDIAAGKYVGQAPAITMRSPLLTVAAQPRLAVTPRAMTTPSVTPQPTNIFVAPGTPGSTPGDGYVSTTDSPLPTPDSTSYTPPTEQFAPPGSTPGDGYTLTTSDNSQPQPYPDSYSQPAQPALPAPSASPMLFGVSWKIWAIGAAVAAGGYLVMNSKMMSANRRRRVRRNRRSRRTR